MFETVQTHIPYIIMLWQTGFFTTDPDSLAVGIIDRIETIVSRFKRK